MSLARDRDLFTVAIKIGARGSDFAKMLRRRVTKLLGEPWCGNGLHSHETLRAGAKYFIDIEPDVNIQLLCSAEARRPDDIGAKKCD